MKAQASREIAEMHIKMVVSVEYQNITKLIATAARTGGFEISIYESIHRNTKEKLVNDGYEFIITDDGRNGTDITIKW